MSWEHRWMLNGMAFWNGLTEITQLLRIFDDPILVQIRGGVMLDGRQCVYGVNLLNHTLKISK